MPLQSHIRCFLPALFAALTTLSASATPPNFVVIYIDDQRADALGFVNPRVQTPNLTRLAGQGLYFPQAFTVSALCSPSRAQLLTGRYGSQNGVTELASRTSAAGQDTSVNAGEPLVFLTLKNAGYRAGLVGKWHIENTPGECGFEYQRWFYGNGDYFDVPFLTEAGDEIPTFGHVEAANVRFGIEFIKEASAAEAPFALFFNTRAPHMNSAFAWSVEDATREKHPLEIFSPPGSWSDDLSGKPAYLKSGRNRMQALHYGYEHAYDLGRHQQGYYSAVSELDAHLGSLFEEMKRLGLMDDTYIILMGDNGWMLGEHRFTSKVLAYEESIRVPLVLAGPGIKPGVSHQLALNIDIAPTLLEWAGLAADPKMYGKSLAAIASSSGAPPIRDAFLYEMPPAAETARNPFIRAIRSSRYKFIRTYDATGTRPAGEDELYDLAIDPEEESNLAGVVNYFGVKRILEDRLEAEMLAVSNGR
ncbi:MAG: sulfatase-like hydrolase/transferase [Opitutaceae bacterium]